MSQLTSPVEIYWISGSPFAWRVLLTAEVKGIPYEGKLLEASKGELKSPEFLAINPLGRVPAIRDGNFTLHESLAIMVYLDRKHPNPPLFGRTAEEAGRIFERISEFISDFWPPSQRLIRSIFFGQPLAADEAKEVREKIHPLAPTGLCGMQHADGEILATRAAEAFGVPFCLSTMSICSIEDVEANATKPFWFQLYVMRNRGFVERLIGRAKQAQCTALVVTLDLPLASQRHKVLRNGLAVPLRLTIANLIDMAMKPKWCLEMLRTRRRSFANLVGHVDGVDDMTSLLAWI